MEQSHVEGCKRQNDTDKADGRKRTWQDHRPGVFRYGPGFLQTPPVVRSRVLGSRYILGPRGHKEVPNLFLFTVRGSVTLYKANADDHAVSE